MPSRIPHKHIDGVEHKRCNTCNILHPTTQYHVNKKNLDNLNGTCKLCRKKKSAARYIEKRAHILLTCKKYQKKNRKKLSLYQAKWVANNRDRVNTLRRERTKKRRKNDPTWAIAKDISSRLSHILSGRQKCRKTLELMGCSRLQLMLHLESRFNFYMSWDNRGPKGWHVDHIVPIRAFNLDNIVEQHVCFWYKNLQPMWAKDNIEKNGKYKKEDKQALIKEWIFYHI